MTREVGSITGMVEVDLLKDGGVCIAYEGAADRYTVAGKKAPQGVTLEDVVAHLSRESDVDDFGNPEPVDLNGLD